MAAAGSVALAAAGGATDAFAAVAVIGLGAGVIWPAQDTLLATVVEPAQRPAVFAVRHTTLNGGFGLGALLAALVVDRAAPASFELIYLLDAASFVAFVPLLLLVRPARADSPAPKERGTFKLMLRDRTFVAVWALTALLVGAGFAQFHAAFPAYATGAGALSAAALSLAFAANTLTVLGAQLPALRVMRGRRRSTGLAGVGLLFAAAWAITAAAGELDLAAAPGLRRGDGRARARGDVGGADAAAAGQRPRTRRPARALQRRARAGVHHRLPRRPGGRRARARGRRWGDPARRAGRRVRRGRARRARPRAPPARPARPGGGMSGWRSRSQRAAEHREHGRYRLAQVLLRDAAHEAEQELGPGAPELVAILNELGMSLKYTGGFEEAERVYTRALRIAEQVVGPDHPDVAGLYHNLGGLEHARGNPERGEPLARRSVQLRRRALGDEHPDVAADRAALAAILDAAGKTAEAEALLRDALAAFEHALGPDDHEVAVTLNNLAALLARSGRC